MTLSLLVGGVLMGLGSGAACACLCGCMLLPLVLGRRGSLGATLSSQPWYAYLQPAGHALAAVLMLRWLSVQSHCDRFAHAGRSAAPHVPIVFGFLSGARLCGPVIGALAQATSAGSVLHGTAFFAAFFLGTSLYLIPLPFTGLLARWPFWTRLGRLAGSVVGFAYLYAAAAGVFAAIHPPRPPHDVSAYRSLCPQALAFKQISDDGVFAAISNNLPRAFIADTRFVPACPSGYGGPVPVALACTTNGIVMDIAVLPHDESPGYMRRVTSTTWWRSLPGSHLDHLCATTPDAVSGATMTANALHTAVRAAAERLVPLVNARCTAAQHAAGPSIRDYVALAGFLFLAATALVMTRIRSLRRPWLRWLVWIGAVVLLGFVRADYFSIAQIGAIIRGTPPPGQCLVWYAVLLFALVSPLFFGRTYCAYLCPFGVMSDAVGRLVGFRITLPGWCIRSLRIARFVLLLLVVAIAATGTHIAIERFEPFHAFFIRPQPMPYVVFCVGVLVVSCVVKRFWCALFCIDGALFELIGRFRWNGRNRRPGPPSQ